MELGHFEVHVLYGDEERQDRGRGTAAATPQQPATLAPRGFFRTIALDVLYCPKQRPMLHSKCSRRSSGGSSREFILPKRTVV